MRRISPAPAPRVRSRLAKLDDVIGGQVEASIIGLIPGETTQRIGAGLFKFLESSLAPPLHMIGSGVVDAVPSATRLPTARTFHPTAATCADEIAKAILAVRHIRIVTDVVVAQYLAPVSRP